MNSEIKRLIQNQIYQAEDNLKRAKLASRHHSLNAKYGDSGITLSEIISMYEKDRDKWTKILEEYSRESEISHVRKS